MKIQKNIYHIYFFIKFISIGLITIVSFCFFLGFDISTKHVFLYLLVLVSIGALSGVLCFFCKKINSSKYIFTEDKLLFEKGRMQKTLLQYEQISNITYYKFYHLLIGDPKGGYLIIGYRENNEEKYIEISASYKVLSKLPIRPIYIK